MDTYQRLNAHAWDYESRKGNFWTVAATAGQVERAKSGQPDIYLTPGHTIDQSWIRPFLGKRVLLLGSGGGQQAVLLAASGCQVTDLDISPAQLATDRSCAQRYGLEIETIQEDMQDLSCLGERTFDLIFNPTSTCFVQDVERVYRECARHLPPGGTLMTSATNPAIYMFDERKALKNKLVVKYTIPYSDLHSLGRKQLEKMVRENDTFEFSHTVDNLVGGLCRAGFAITGFSTDSAENEAMDSFLHDCYFAIRAQKL